MVGGAYINGTAESMGRDGLLWTIGPVGYNISLLLGLCIYFIFDRQTKSRIIKNCEKKIYAVVLQVSGITLTEIKFHKKRSFVKVIYIYMDNLEQS